MDNRVFIAELIQDIPLWTALIMSIYPEYQNEYIFYLSLFIGIIASIYIAFALKKGIYDLDKVMEKPSELIPFFIYSILLLLFVLFLTVKGKLYMSGFIWGYVILTSTMELFFFKRENPQE